MAQWTTGSFPLGSYKIKRQELGQLPSQHSSERAWADGAIHGSIDRVSCTVPHSLDFSSVHALDSLLPEFQREHLLKRHRAVAGEASDDE